MLYYKSDPKPLSQGKYSPCGSCTTLHQPRVEKMFLICRKCSVCLCEPNAALQPKLHLYKPTDTIALEHVVLISSRARLGPVKALVHNDHSLCRSNENHMLVYTQIPWSQSLFSVMSCPLGTPFPSLQTMALYSFNFFRLLWDYKAPPKHVFLTLNNYR